MDTIAPSGHSYTPTLVTGEVRGCLVTLLTTTLPGSEASHMLTLDRVPATYCRSITPVELAALAQTNPDDGIPVAALNCVCDLTMALATLSGTGAIITRFEPDSRRETLFVEFVPMSRDELSALGSLANDLLAPVGSVRPC